MNNANFEIMNEEETMEINGGFFGEFFSAVAVGAKAACAAVGGVVGGGMLAGGVIIVGGAAMVGLGIYAATHE